MYVFKLDNIFQLSSFSGHQTSTLPFNSKTTSFNLLCYPRDVMSIHLIVSD